MISLDPSDQVIILLYFGAVLLVGFLSVRRSSEAVEFLLAGRSLTTPVFVMTLVSTWYGGILGVGEFSYQYGISNWVLQGVPYYLFAFLFAFLLARRIRRTNLMTIPDKLEEAYGRKTALLGAFLTFLLMTPAPYILMAALLLQLVTGWGLFPCALLGTIVTTAYLFSGGFRSDVNTDILEFFLMFFGFAIILPFAWAKFGGFDFIRQNVPPSHLTWDGGNPVQFVLVWFFIALWTLVDPAFHQRCYAARSGEVAQRGILISIVFWVLFDAITATAGLYARAAIPDLAQPVMAYPLLAELTLPPVAKGLFYVGMLATIMSSLNTLALISATTLGRDIVWRIGKERARPYQKRLTQWGLVVTAVLSLGLALLIPSVIKLWYTIGTVIIPGLLVPLVTSYFEKWKAPPRYAFASMLLGWLTSTIWLLIGWRQQLGVSEFYPFGIEPMYPGLAVSVAVWWAGWRGR
ncbi:MAG: Na+/proline symporter [Bacteroidetes bacterium]|nr:Na+/proline symporter [Bacteroidota bacterium]